MSDRSPRRPLGVARQPGKRQDIAVGQMAASKSHAKEDAVHRQVCSLGPGNPSQGCAVSSWTGRRAGQRSAENALGQQARAWAKHYLRPAGVLSNGIARCWLCSFARFFLVVN
jgi:hypothetical protein